MKETLPPIGLSLQPERGSRLLELRRPREAAAVFRAYLATNPQDAFGHAMLAYALRESGDARGAEAEARRAVSLDPAHPFAHGQLAAALIAQSKWHRAEAAVGEALRLEQQVWFYSLLAQMLYLRGDCAGSLNAAERGLALQPTESGCMAFRVLALRKLGKSAAAETALQKMLEHHPDNVVAIATKGWEFLEKGHRQAAAERFREALRLDPHFKYARVGLEQAEVAGTFFGPFLGPIYRPRNWRSSAKMACAVTAILVTIGLMVLAKLTPGFEHLSGVGTVALGGLAYGLSRYRARW